MSVPCGDQPAIGGDNDIGEVVSPGVLHGPELAAGCSFIAHDLPAVHDIDGAVAIGGKSLHISLRADVPLVQVAP